MTFLILFVLLVASIGGIGYASTTAAERKRLVEGAFRLRQQLAQAAPLRQAQIVSFWTLLRERTPFAPVTPVLVALNIVVFTLILFGAGTLDNPDTFISWGASFGPRTTNGEWWRLATTLFVHVGVLHLLADTAGLLTVGLVLERLVGPIAFAVVYVVAGVSSSAFGLDAAHTGVTVGPSGAIFGLYGLMLTVTARSAIYKSLVMVPLAFAKYVVPPAVLFILYSLMSGAVASGPEISAFAVGCLSGLVVGRGLGEEPAPPMLAMPIAAGAFAMVVVIVWPLSGMTDVRPEIYRLVTAEEQMAARYQRATDQFINGRIDARTLAGVIDRDIVPQLQASRARVTALQRVPDEQRPLLAAAQKYLQLRDTSWRTRAKGLNVGSTAMLKQAEVSEMAARDTLRDIE